MPPLRVVLDTASFISGLRSSKGAAYQILRLVLRQEITLVLDYKLLCEYQDVAFRDEQLGATSLSRGEISELIDTLMDRAEPCEAVQLLRPLSPDPNDDMVLELAVSAGVDAIVTNNTRHFWPAAQTLGILVMTPGELLASLRRGPNQ